MVDHLESLIKNFTCKDNCTASCFPHGELTELFHVSFY